MAALSQTLGQLDAREVMTPLLQRFFSCFDCVYRLDEKSGTNVVVVRKYSFLDDDYQEVSSDVEKDIATGVSNSCEDIMTSAMTSSQSGNNLNFFILKCISTKVSFGVKNMAIFIYNLKFHIQC